MNDAKDNGVPIVYISLGSMLFWEKWEVDAVYYGLKKLGCKVIWSIKTPELVPVQDDPDFWVSKWVP